jgi:hypothetical protein
MYCLARLLEKALRAMLEQTSLTPYLSSSFCISLALGPCFALRHTPPRLYLMPAVFCCSGATSGLGFVLEKGTVNHMNPNNPVNHVLSYLVTYSTWRNSQSHMIPFLKLWDRNNSWNPTSYLFTWKMPEVSPQQNLHDSPECVCQYRKQSTVSPECSEYEVQGGFTVKAETKFMFQRALVKTFFLAGQWVLCVGRHTGGGPWPWWASNFSLEIGKGGDVKSLSF